jgi:hypothetical protein
MILKIIAKLNKRGSETAQYNHYTFGKPGSDVNGGVYIKKSTTNPPDVIEIEIEQKKGE